MSDENLALVVLHGVGYERTVLDWRYLLTMFDRLYRFFGKKRAPAAPEGIQMQTSISAFLEAKTGEEAQRIVEQHPELLSDDFDDKLGQMLTEARIQDNAQAAHVFEELLALLRRCREVGVEAAFAENINSFADPPEFQLHVRRAEEAEARYQEHRDLQNLDAAVAAWEHIVQQYNFAA